MRISSRDLQAVQRGGMLARYALMGPVAFVHVDLPSAGTAGTGLEDACLTDHHGIVIRGEFVAHFDDGRPAERFEAGSAFYVPAGPPTHHFTSTGQTRVAGFSRVAPDLDTGADALSRLGLESVENPSTALGLPGTVRVEGGATAFPKQASVETEGRVMGSWLFMRSVLGPKSGYTSTWCEVPHWGLVLSGDMAVTYRDDVEFVSAGDAFYTPAGHRFESAEGASIVDYTPMSDLDPKRGLPAWRRKAVDRLVPRAPGVALETRALTDVLGEPQPSAPVVPAERRVIVGARRLAFGS